MSRRPRRCSVALAAGLAAVAILAGACGSVRSYAAKVDGRPIASAELEDELRSIASNEAYLRLVEERQGYRVKGTGQGTFDAAFSALALTRQIYFRLITAELARRKLSIGPEDLAAARVAVVEQLQGEAVLTEFPRPYQQELIHREAQIDVLTLSVNKVDAPDTAARAYYDTHQGEFNRSCVRHILVATPEKAAELKRRLDAGEDFAAVARADSADPVSAPNGGLLDCLDASSGFVPELLEAALNQPVGVVGPPVVTQFGHHLIKVDSRSVPPYAEVKDEALARLTAAGEREVQLLLRKLATDARIEVNPRYGSFDKDLASPSVKPAEAPVPPRGAAPAEPVLGE